MPDPLKETVEKLSKNLTEITGKLEPRIQELEALGKGSAEVKELVDKMSIDNAAFVDQIKAVKDAMTKAAEDDAAFREGVSKRLAEGKNSAAFKTPGLRLLEERKEDPEYLAKVRRGSSSIVIRFPHWGLFKGQRDIVPIVIPSPEQIKAITNVQASAGDTVDYMRVPGIVGPGERALIIRDLLPVGTTSSDTVRYVREELVTDSAAPQAGQGVTKAESDFDFEALTCPIETIAHFVVISTQLLDDAIGLQSYIDSRMRYLLLLEEEDQLLNGDGTGNNLNGLNTQATAYNATLETDLAIASPTDIDKVRVAMYQVSSGSEFPPTGVVMNPFNWAGIELTKDTQGRYIFVNPANQTAPRLWGIPVAVTLSQPQHDFLVGSFALGAQVWDRMDAAVAISTEDSTNFRQNLATLRVEERLCITVYRPLAFVTGEFTTGSGA